MASIIVDEERARAVAVEVGRQHVFRGLVDREDAPERVPPSACVAVPGYAREGAALSRQAAAEVEEEPIVTHAAVAKERDDRFREHRVGVVARAKAEAFDDSPRHLAVEPRLELCEGRPQRDLGLEQAERVREPREVAENARGCRPYE
jgi:hypothetical protein